MLFSLVNTATSLLMCDLAFVPFTDTQENCLLWSALSMSLTKNFESQTRSSWNGLTRIPLSPTNQLLTDYLKQNHMIKILPGCSSNSDRLGAVITPLDRLGTNHPFSEEPFSNVKICFSMSKKQPIGITCRTISSDLGLRKVLFYPEKRPSLNNWRLKGR